MIPTLKNSNANNKNYSDYDNTLSNNGNDSFKRFDIDALNSSTMAYQDLPNLVHINRIHLIFQGAFQFAPLNNNQFDRITLWILNRSDESNNSFGIDISDTKNSVDNNQNDNDNNNFSDSNINQITKYKFFYNIVITFIKKHLILMLNKRVKNKKMFSSLSLSSTLLLLLLVSNIDICHSLREYYYDGTPINGTGYSIPYYDAYNSALSLDIQSVFTDLFELLLTSDSCWATDSFNGEESYPGLFLRLTWHAAGTVREADDGRIRFPPESSWMDNASSDHSLTLISWWY